MATASTNPAPASPQKNLGLQPDEPVWVRYSPHGELPLSSVTSFVIHGLVIGLACLAIWSASRFLDHPTRSLPIQTVQLAPGGGGGDPNGVVGGKGSGSSGQVEAGGTEQPGDSGSETPDPDLKRPDLKNIDLPKVPVTDKTGKPTVQDGRNMSAFTNLAQQGARMRQASQAGPKGQGGPRSRGEGGPGEGGGEGSGSGTKKGSGRGEGDPKANMTRQERRMARWAMLFDTHNGPDYLRQLAGLGAVLAIPVREGPQGYEYEIVQNRNLLHPPARLVKEDLSKYKGIRWTDDNADSVAQVMQTLGLPMRPPHFVAFMPLPLEDRLAQLEKRFKGRAEDDIFETRFKIIPTGTNYTPIVIDQTPKSEAPR
jgi:hypothetical protein